MIPLPVRLAGLAALVSCSDNNGTGTNQTPVDLRLQEVVSGLLAPLHLTSPPGDDRLFITEQAGRIRIVRNGQLLPTSFLDISSKVSSGGERGLLSLAFHPEYAQNGFFYVNYTNLSGDTRVERYQVSGNADVADGASAKLILAVAQPFINHNGGHVLFGPDGMLYIGMGDGGGANDPDENGQDRSTLLGAILRIDVDGGDPYAVPPDNPFVGQAGMRGEIWAWGVRNPWRMAFDRVDNVFYHADVGQSAWEEVNAVPSSEAGVNYGWDVMEGQHCHEPSSGCNQQGLTLPVLEYSHSEGCSITGGLVYRGSGIPEIQGHYFYGDLCEGGIGSFELDGGQATRQARWDDFPEVNSLASFGEDADGELYVVSLGGTVYRVERD